MTVRRFIIIIVVLLVFLAMFRKQLASAGPKLGKSEVIEKPAIFPRKHPLDNPGVSTWPLPRFKLNPLHVNTMQSDIGSMQDLARFFTTQAQKAVTLYPLFDRFFILEEKPAQLKIPEPFADKVRAIFQRYPGGTKSLNFVENQVIVTSYNRYTEEYSLFNEVRRYRPGYSERLSAEKEEEVNKEMMSNEGAETCDFCSKERTAMDVFGRIEGQHCFTASNVAKYEQWHGLLIGNKHHPLTWSKAILIDYLQTAHRWFAKVNSIDSEARFPHIMWDAGFRASASQLHQHLQLSIVHDRFYMRAEHTRLAAAAYARHYGKDRRATEDSTGSGNYWADLVSLHESLGLAVRHNRSVVISYIAPIKERELIVVTEDSHSTSFAELIAAALTAMKDDIGIRAFSMAIILEPIGKPLATASVRSAGRDDGDDADFQRHKPLPYPAIARIVDRGNPLDRRSDVGAMEFYGANNVGADPFHIMAALTKRVKDLSVV